MSSINVPPVVGPGVVNRTDADPDAKLREAARAMEASFLAIMLKSAGFGEARDAFGGGTGEDQFSSFMVQAQADEMVKAGGIGLAESLFAALQRRRAGTV